MAYQFIMLESIFRIIEDGSKDMRVISLTEIFTQFAMITVPWVNEYQLLLKDNTSVANEIISKIEETSLSRGKCQVIGKKLMNSIVGKWVIPNITKYEDLFRYREDKNIYLTQMIVDEIYDHLGQWRRNPLTYEVSRWAKRKEILRPSCYAPVRGPRYSNTTLLRYAKTLPELYIRDELEFKLILHIRRCLEEIEVQMNQKERFQIEIKETKVFIDENSQIIVESKKRVKKFDKETLMAKPREIYRYIIGLDR